MLRWDRPIIGRYSRSHSARHRTQNERHSRCVMFRAGFESRSDFGLSPTEKEAHIAAEWALEMDCFQNSLRHLFEGWLLSGIGLRCNEQTLCLFDIAHQLYCF